jgi:aminoglycoside/choline kinase family phosphotransferase
MRESLKSRIESRFPGSTIEELAGDASTRKFYRLFTGSGESLVVMDYGSPFAEPTDDQRLTEIFIKGSLPVPRIVEAIPDAGCLLLEDLGRRMLEDELRGLDGQGQPPELLLRAAELAGRIARDGSPALAASGRAPGTALDAELFRFEMDFFLENFLIKFRKIKGGQGELRGCLHQLADSAAETPLRVLCHRDYHCRNIMIAGDGSLAMVDLQDARWGPDTYDFASLAFDAYVEGPDAWVEPLLRRFLETAGINDDTLLRGRVHRVAAQRMIKALGTFGYQVGVAGNRRYMDAIPRTLSRLDRWLGRDEETSSIHAAFGSLGLFEALP